MASERVSDSIEHAMSDLPAIRLELYGVPRARAGASELTVPARTLGEALAELERRLPVLRDVCVIGGRLKPGYLVNINGQRFTSDVATPLADGDSILILSADAGG